MTSEKESTRLTDSDVLQLPSNTEALDARANEIASNFVNEHVVRVELAAICLWRQSGSISGVEVYNLASQSIMTSLDSSDEYLAQPVYADGLTVWGNLQQLAAGQTVTFEQQPEPEDPERFLVSDNDAYEAWRERQHQRAIAWFETVMKDADVLMTVDKLYYFEVDDFLPNDLKNHLSHETARELFDGLHGTGAALHYKAVSGSGGLGNNPEAAVYFADALARALSHSVQDIKTASEDDKPIIASEILLWWGLLKGFVYSGAHQTVNVYEFGPLLSRFPVVKDRIVQSLQDGLLELNLHDYPKGIWNGGHSILTTTIASTPTDDVINDLLGAVAIAEERARAWESMR